MICSICSRSPSVFGPYDVDRVVVCEDCAARIAELASNNPSVAWAVAESGPLLSTIEAREASMPALVDTLGGSKLIEDASKEPLPWSKLVAAFTDRRLYHLAVRICGLMMKRGSEDTEIALRHLLSPPLIQPDGIAAIQVIVRRQVDGANR